MKKIKVGIIQQRVLQVAQDNLLKIKANIETVARNGAKLVVLEELHNSPYFCQTEDTKFFDLAEGIPGKTTQFYGAIARENRVVLVTSLFERRAPGIYHNTAVVFETDGTIAGIYRKMHIPDDPAYYEKFYFTPGDLGFEPIDTSVGRLGVLVCWDQWFPEAARLMALKGAEILIYPTAIGYDLNDTLEEQNRQRDAWETVQRGHAIANGIYTITVNRVGYEPENQDSNNGIQFWGNSFVAGPQGEILFRASTRDEQNAIVTIDLDQTEKVRQIWPFFRDRRVDFYDDINKKYLK